MSTPYIDMESGLSRVRGNKGLYARMLGLFLKSEDIPKFDSAMAAGDHKTAAEAIHAIKGVSGNLGLTAVFEASSQLMDQFRQGEVDEALVATYQADIAKTLTEVEALMAELSA